MPRITLTPWPFSSSRSASTHAGWLRSAANWSCPLTPAAGVFGLSEESTLAIAPATLADGGTVLVVLATTPGMTIQGAHADAYRSLPFLAFCTDVSRVALVP